MDHKNKRFIKIKKGIGKSFSIISDRWLKSPCCFTSRHVNFYLLMLHQFVPMLIFCLI